MRQVPEYCIGAMAQWRDPGDEKLAYEQHANGNDNAWQGVEFEIQAFSFIRVRSPGLHMAGAIFISPESSVPELTGCC